MLLYTKKQKILKTEYTEFLILAENIEQTILFFTESIGQTFLHASRKFIKFFINLRQNFSC